MNIETFFAYKHLPDDLQLISLKFYELAYDLDALVKDNPLRDEMLMKLWEAKNLAVWMEANRR